MASLGLGASGFAFLGGLSRFRSLFVVFTGSLLLAGYWFMEKQSPSRASKIIYWSSAVLAILALYLPKILTLL